MATTKNYRDYRADYTSALITKMFNSDLITFFARKPFLNTNSLKVSVRYLKGSALLKDILIKLDATKIYVYSLSDLNINSKNNISEVMFLVLPISKRKIVLSYHDYFKMKFNKFTAALMETFNIYFQCFEKLPEHGNF